MAWDAKEGSLAVSLGLSSSLRRIWRFCLRREKTVSCATQLSRAGDRFECRRSRVRFGDILMKEFYKSVVANMGGKTVKKTQARSFAQQQTVKNAIVKGPASLAILLKFIEAHEAREAAREALDADVAMV